MSLREVGCAETGEAHHKYASNTTMLAQVPQYFGRFKDGCFQMQMIKPCIYNSFSPT